MTRLKSIIVDDEPIARQGLEEDLREIGFIEVAGIAENSLQAIELVMTGSPDLILLDIEMPRLNGLDFIKSLKNPPMVIITTAYPEYALAGYELDVIDYLIKPVDFQRLLKACNKAREFCQLRRYSIQPDHPGDHYFFVKCNGQYEKIILRDLLFVEAADNYVIIHTIGRKFMTYQTLKNMEDLLPGNNFIRVHKSYIVALDKISNISGHEISIDKTKIPLSRNLKDALMERILNKKPPGAP
ncbi:MAG TPA: LytTR family DNA-binding domain-containing protein [Puia sp.]|nr:LytTR family DNA-binding domain-containing protein [Puia sp.]